MKTIAFIICITVVSVLINILHWPRAEFFSYVFGTLLILFLVKGFWQDAYTKSRIAEDKKTSNIVFQNSKYYFIRVANGLSASLFCIGIVFSSLHHPFGKTLLISGSILLSIALVAYWAQDNENPGKDMFRLQVTVLGVAGSLFLLFLL